MNLESKKLDDLIYTRYDLTMGLTNVLDFVVAISSYKKEYNVCAFFDV